MFSDRLPWRQQRRRAEQGLPAVQRPAGRRDRRQGAGGGGCHRRRAGRRAGEGSRAFQLGPPAGRLALPEAGRAAVPRYQAAHRPDGPDDRRAAVPGPAGRRSDRARAVLGAVAARHGGDQGRRRSGALSRVAARRSISRWRMRWPAIRSPLSWQLLLGGGPERSRRQVQVRAGAAEAEFRRAAAGRRGDRRDARDHRRPGVREGRRRARAHHRSGRAGRRGIRHRRARRGGGPDRQRRC